MVQKALLILLGFAAFSYDLSAQCSMCSAVAETAQKNGSELASGLNAGILYLMGIPYALIIGIGYVMFRRLNRHKVE